MIKTGGAREIVFFPLVLALFCLGPPVQADPVSEFPGPTLNLMAPMPAVVSEALVVLDTAPVLPPPTFAAMTMFDRYMRTEIPVALPPARAVIELRTASRHYVVRSGASRASPARLSTYHRSTWVMRI